MTELEMLKIWNQVNPGFTIHPVALMRFSEALLKPNPVKVCGYCGRSDCPLAGLCK